ncbi:hypothetical protein OG349_32095 [Streptomyces sp. NBC_01317]|nr:hypothetical protein OG349_32095 [Streptomyces sp. NBC_01317]
MEPRRTHVPGLTPHAAAAPLGQRLLYGITGSITATGTLSRDN